MRRGISAPRTGLRIISNNSVRGRLRSFTLVQKRSCRGRQPTFKGWRTWARRRRGVHSTVGSGMSFPMQDKYATRRGSNHPRWRGGNPQPVAELRRQHAKASANRYPERRRAREIVKDAVRRGDLAPIKTQTCFDCGDQACAYDHFDGYDKPLSVQPVCSKCHGRRSRERGEHKLNGRKRVTPSLKGATLDGREWREFPK